MAPRSSVCTPGEGWRGQGTSYAGLRAQPCLQSCQRPRPQSCPSRRAPRRAPQDHDVSDFLRPGPRGPGGPLLRGPSVGLRPGPRAVPPAGRISVPWSARTRTLFSATTPSLVVDQLAAPTHREPSRRRAADGVLAASSQSPIASRTILRISTAVSPSVKHPGSSGTLTE